MTRNIPSDRNEIDFDAPLAPYWPVNALSIVIGAAMMAIAFTFLDPMDPRPGYNPWTYAIATPIALLLLSAIVGMIVSRRVEKTMQLAFLLSVLVHLLLVVYAMNVVIFSHIWPHVFDPAELHRREVKQQRLRAKQYYQFSSVEKPGELPEYRRPVTTEFEAAEAEPEKLPTLQMARSETQHIPTPQPRIPVETQPQLIERNKPDAPSAVSDLAPAELSRSDLLRRLETSRQARAAQVPADARVDPTQRPAELLPQRRRVTDAAVPQARLAKNRPVPEAVPPQRRVPLETRSVDQVPVQRPSEAVRQLAPPRARTLAEATPVPAQQRAESLPRAASQLQRSAANASSTLPPADRSPMPLELQQPPSRSIAARQSTTPGLPDPGDTVAMQPLRRETAGGRAPASAKVSIPSLASAASIGSQESGADTVPLASTVIQRHDRSGQASSAALHSGLTAAPAWTGEISVGAGSSQRIALQTVDNAGQAAVDDLADLFGSGQTIQRADIGAAVPAGGSVAVPEQLLATDSTGQATASGAAVAASAPIARSGSGSDATAVLSGPGTDTSTQVTDQLQKAVLGSGHGAAMPLASLADTTIGLDEVTEGRLDRNGPMALAQAAPALSTPAAVPLPGNADNSQQPEAGQGSEDGRIDSDAALRRTAQSPGGSPAGSLLREPSMPLQIDEKPGAGGLIRIAERAGSLLAKADARALSEIDSELFTQRFTRKRAGGPLGAGTPIPVPTPAFEQRLNRLRDPAASESTMVAPQTDLAIERGLEFLARYQRPDGSWRLQDFDTRVLIRSDTAATGLALLAFQGAGYTHLDEKYADVVARAIEYLRQHQQANGDLYVRQDPASDQNAWLYSHAIAALALTEAYGMTQDPEVGLMAQRAVDFIAASQDPRRGGWRYRPGMGSDTSVSGWFMMALQSARLAGLEVPQATIDRLNNYLSFSQASPQEPHLYRYNPFAPDTPQQRHGLQPTPTMTSVGLLMRLYLGWRRDNPNMRAGADYLLAHPPEHGTPTESLRDTYYWYYATQVIFHMGGDYWRQWHDRLYPLLINSQVTEGPMAGSWHPLEPVPDLWGHWAGRLYVTTMNLLSLEVSYRHLPLYDATAR